jgi:calcineurin-like phosphoesterase family protein
MGHMGPHIIAVQPPNSDMYSRKWRITMIHFRDSNQESQVIKHPGEDVLLYHFATEKLTIPTSYPKVLPCCFK